MLYYGGAMYKIRYVKLAILDGGEIGNISQGNGTAYMDCELENIERKLKDNLLGEKDDLKYHPIIKNVEKIEGHIVI